MALAALREHAERATATDTNPRSLRFARFNGMLNGARRAPRRPRGQPVRARRRRALRPHPLQPAVHGLAGERRSSTATAARASAATLVEAAPRHLEEGGIFVCLGELDARQGRRLAGAPARVDGRLGLRRAGLRPRVVRPADLRGRLGPRRRAATSWSPRPRLERWLAWFDEQGIELVELGRRPAAPPLGRRELVPRRDAAGRGQRLRRAPDPPPARRPGPAAAARAGARRRCSTLPLVLPADHRIDQVGRFVPDGSEVESLTLRFASGLGTRIALDLPTAQALGALDGAPARRARCCTPRRSGIGAEDPDAFARAGVAGFRRLLELGLLAPAGRALDRRRRLGGRERGDPLAVDVQRCRERRTAPRGWSRARRRRARPRPRRSSLRRRS